MPYKYCHIRSIQRTHHAGDAAVASEVVGSARTIDVGDVRELNQSISDISDSIHDRVGLCRTNGPKVMSECENRPPVPNSAEFLVHRVV